MTKEEEEAFSFGRFFQSRILRGWMISEDEQATADEYHNHPNIGVQNAYDDGRSAAYER